MGIYSDGKIYGISIRLDLVVYERTYPHKITLDQIQEAKDFYNSFDSVERKGRPLTVKIYVKCSSTYTSDSNSFMSWVPSDLISKE